MRIAICEDTALDMEGILDLCDAYANARGYILHTLLYGHAEKLLADPQARDTDAVLLDIMMAGANGMAPLGVEVARRLRAEGYAGAIIFATTSEAYYPEGFEVGAMHYLVKPISLQAFSTAMDRAVQTIKHPERVITVPVNRIQVSIAQSQILFAEVYGRETMLQTTTEKVRVLLPLKRIEELLDGDPFLRCYRSYIINMEYVSSLEDDHFVMRNGIHIPISLRNRQSLRERYFAFRMAQAR